MKRTLIIIAGVLLCVWAAAITGLQAQSIDKERMEKDLEIAKNILANMRSENGLERLFSSRDIDARYVEDFGVVFSVGTNSLVTGFYNLSTSIPQPPPPPPTVEYSESRETEEVREKRREYEETVVIAEEARQKAEAALQEVRGNVYRIQAANAEVKIAEMKEVWAEFLLNYADLISQLKPTDQIMISTQKNSGNVMVYGSGSNATTIRSSDRPSSGLIAEISKKTISDYKAGKISEDQARELIKFSEPESVVIPRDLNVFMDGILTAFFSPESSETYFLSGRSNIETLGNKAFIYNLSFYSSYPSFSGSNKIHRMPTVDKNNVPDAERNKIVTEMYPEFVEDFKDVIAQYGRTISSLKDDQKLIMLAQITSCVECGIPETIEVSVDGKTLNGLAKGTISENEARKRIDVKEIGKQ